MEDEYLTKCVVDTLKRTFYLYSSDGDERVVKCDTVDEFMSVLDVVRNTAPDDVVSYTNPL
jgi:hypothetical protein|tara:strand:+ start:283 stop:465 length:183 start_codon:yes stop_codon:yes gene_type:complete